MIRTRNNTTPARASARPPLPRIVAIAPVVWLLLAAGAAAQPSQPDTSPNADEPPRVHLANFLGGAALGLAGHEAAHLVFDLLVDADPGLKKVDFGGIPFVAITHRSNLSPRREYLVSSAGFHTQHLASEWLLTRRPRLRWEDASVAKGVLAFNIGASVAYGGAAFARVGPPERDTRGMADSRKIDERWIGAMVLAPALLDAYRYFHPDADWARWASRGVKVGVLLFVVK